MRPEDLKALESAATPAPWTPCLGPDYEHLCTAISSDAKGGGGVCDVQPVKFDEMGYTKSERDFKKDQDLICILRNLAPELIALWEAVEQEGPCIYGINGQEHLGILKALGALNTKAAEGWG